MQNTTQAPARPRRLSRLLAAATALAVGLAGLIAAAPAAAAELPGAITSVTTDKTTYGYSEQLRLEFVWAVPDTAVVGDTFALDLPAELNAASLAKFALLAPDGSVVANAAWQGKRAVFTLTDYVDTHDGVGGSGFFRAKWDHAVVTTEGAPITLDFGGIAVEVVIDPKPAPNPGCGDDCPPPPPVRTERGLWKGGSWADGAYEGTRDETGNINWTVELPGRPSGYDGPIEVVDTPGAGNVVECATIAVTTRPSLAGGTPSTPVDPSRYELDCSPAGFTFTLDAIGASEFVNLSYKGTITDQLSGRYRNGVVFTAPGAELEQVREVKRTDAGGNGDGKQSVSVGDLVWLDADRDGEQDAAEAGIPGVALVLTGPDGKPVVNVDGAAVASIVTDARGRYTFAKLPVLPAGQHYTVALDQAASGDALRGLVPTEAGAGADRAADSSTGTATSGDLTTNGAADPTLDFGFVREQVSVGDLVWLDADRDGLQDADEVGIPGVTLALTGPDGEHVIDVHGEPVAPVVTDEDGRYAFEHLPTLPAGEHYTVTIDRTASAAALKDLLPTKAGAGEDRAADSSKDSAASTDLVEDGAHDPTLDFGFMTFQL
ncbi:MAG TPA: SdrD B-like domain-containing protein, partial [Rhodoglobus sp.]|nr:SdrD B-like domain-containing protein [Rhodoglobus sp.]